MLDQAAMALETGRLDEARAGFEAVLRLDAQQFDAWNLLGVVTMHARDFLKAIDMFERAVAIAPDEAMAHVNLGLARMESQQPEQALRCFEQALALEPDNVEALFPRSLAQLALAQWEAALLSSTQIVAQQPGHVEAHFNQGRALLELKRHEEALAAYDQVLARQPGHVSALINRGLALSALARYPEALGSHDQAIALEPTRPSAHAHRSGVLAAMRRFDEALASCERSLALHPGQVDQLINRGNILFQMERWPEAAGSYEQALRLDPRCVAALVNLGAALRKTGQWDVAQARCDQALALDPDHLGAHINRAGALLDNGHWTLARDAFAKVVSMAPDNAEALWGLGWCNLLMGDWANGFAQFEARWHKPDLPAIERRTFSQPLWLGRPNDMDLRGRTILLYAEQGLGDTIQFCRYAAQVAALGAKVVLEVQPPLKKLMQSLPVPGMQVVARGTYPMPAFDCRCPLMSLPLAFKTTPASVPLPTAYLHADPGLVKIWATRLGNKTRPRIGLAWSGNASHRNNANRSVPLAQLLSALPAGIDTYVLQQGITDEDMAALQAHGVQYLPQALQNFDETAALVAHMDLVISIDTSIAHLAGALGRPTWVLLSTILDWRWLLDRPDTPWYASMRLFRQSTTGQWDAPLQEMAAALGTQFAQASAMQPHVPPGPAPHTLH
jgi:tetratricopeptide (TPR) repeat protein